MSIAVLPCVVDLSLAVSVMLPDSSTSPSIVVPCCRVKMLLPSPTTLTDDPVTLLTAPPAVVVTVSKVIGAKNVLPP